MVIRMTPVATVCASHLPKVIRETSLFEGVVKDIVVPTASLLLSFDTGRRTLGTYELQKEHKFNVFKRGRGAGLTGQIADG